MRKKTSSLAVCGALFLLSVCLGYATYALNGGITSVGVAEVVYVSTVVATISGIVFALFATDRL